MSVRDWMSRDPLTIGPQTVLREALTRMVRHRVKHLPIVEEGRLLGMLDGHDLLAVTADPERKAVDLCREVVPLGPEAPVREALQRLQSATCVPVTEEGRLVGMFTHGNLLRYLLREMAPERLRRSPVTTANRFEVLASLMRDVSQAQDIQQMLTLVARHAGTLMPVEQAFILLCQPEQPNDLTVAASHGAGDIELMPLQDTLSGWVITQRKSLHIEDLRSERRFPTSRQKLESEELRSVIAAPLLDGRTCLGVVHLWSRKAYAYVDSDLELLELVAGNITFLVERSWRLEREHKLVAELKRANQIKDEFLAVVTHDLRNAVQGVLSYSQILARKAPDEKLAKLARGLVDTAQYMRALTNDLHDLARLGMSAIRLDPVPLDLAELVQRACLDLVDFARGESVELREPQVEPQPLKADRVRLRQVVDNLVSNAIKYNRPGGWVQVRSRKENGQVVLEVQDNGIGIDPAEQEKVFGLFQRASNHKRSDSSGLGLSIARRLVELHGGSLTLESEAGKGSLFRVSLPV
jgi:signal transduction histidine kinase